MSDAKLLADLMALGVDEKRAKEIEVGIEGGDYVNLVNALGIADPQLKAKAAEPILSKYGITISEETGDMADSKNYLSAMFSKFREGKGTAIDTAILGEWLKPISESNAPDVSTLAMEGFNYFMQLEDSMQGEPLMDWLDENKVEYITDGKGQFHIKCDDRESAYRVGKAANGLIMKKRMVRDQIGEATYTIYGRDDTGIPSQRDPSIRHHETVLLSVTADSEDEAREKAMRICGIRTDEITKIIVSENTSEESFEVLTTKGVINVQGSDEFAAKRNARNRGYTVLESKSAKQREAEARAKMADIKPRNQDLLALSQRGGKGAHKDDTRKTDAFDRKAKHKKLPVDEAAGLSIDNQVADDLTDTLAESVLGMKVLSPIFRLRELAGMAPAPMAPPEIDDIDGIEVDHDDSGYNDPMSSAPSALAPGPVDIEDPFMVGAADPVDSMADLMPNEPMGGGMDAMSPIGGMPGDLPPMGGEAVLAVPTQSDAMSHIEDCLNDIQGKLAEIRLAEYKSLVQKLTSLTQQVQTMGRDYLGEQRRKK
jgi:hypothetical protein